MSMTSEYGEEELMLDEEEGVEQQAKGVVPLWEDVAETEIGEWEHQEAELLHLDAEENEAHAAGAVCERCGAVIVAKEDVRRLPDGNWIHQDCPVAIEEPGH